MASIKDIVDAYKLVYSAPGKVQRVEVVDAKKRGQLSDPAQGIAAWHGADSTKISDDAKKQIVSVRKDLMALDPGLPEGKYDKPKFISKRCKGKNLYFREQGNKAFFTKLEADFNDEIKTIKAALASATDAATKAQKHKELLQTIAFKHLMNGREGPMGAVNTYDSAIVTWGMGWAITGYLGHALADTYRVENAITNPDERYIQKLLYLAGFLYDRGTYYVVDTDAGTVHTTNSAGIAACLHSKDSDGPPDNPALRLIHDIYELHVAWALLGRDDLTRKTMMRAQLETFKTTTGDVPQADKIQTGAFYTFIAHLQHWTGSHFDVVGWATGPKARPGPVKETLPSEKGDAELAIQAVHQLYHSKSPDWRKAVFTQPREYWKQMAGVDTIDEGLTEFKPVYAIMTNPPVTSVPSDHLKAVTDAKGTTYDLGPLSDFVRAPVPDPEITDEEREAQKRMYLPNLVDLDSANAEHYEAERKEREQREQTHERSSVWQFLR
jgi:hypothetical protein